MIPYGRQDINQADIDAVVEVLKSDFLTQGPVVPLFEGEVARKVHAKYAVATSSSTSALHVACIALGLGPGDWLWTSPNTFVASSNCALYCGAQVDFVDIDPRTYNLSIERLSEKLAKAKTNNTLPKVVVPVHLCGQSCNMLAIKKLADQYGFKIIEDASHAIGGRYKDIPIGSCAYSDITVFSFHPVKIITSGEGGMALTNNSKLAHLMQRYRSHGITSDPIEMNARPLEEIWNYQQKYLGFNYRMTDIHAALGLSQLGRLDEFVQRRRKIAHRYDEMLSKLPLVLPFQHPDSYSSYHLYPIKIDILDNFKSHRQIYNELRHAGIDVNLHYIPVYRQPYYEGLGFERGYCPEAERFHRSVISIPIFPALSEAQQNTVVSELKRILANDTGNNSSPRG